MKRRETKKNIRKAERHLTQAAVDYLNQSERGGNPEENSPYFPLVAVLTWLLDDHLKIYSPWNFRERWLDGIWDPQIKLTQETLEINGEMVWGLRSSISGDE